MRGTTLTGRLAGVERALVMLDVPVVVAKELALEYGEGVWWQLVRNSRAQQGAKEAVRQILEKSPDGLTGLWMVVCGLLGDTPGVRGAVISGGDAPDCLLVWMVKNLTLSIEEQRELVTRARSKIMLAYLGHANEIDKAVQREARRISGAWSKKVFNHEAQLVMWNSEMNGVFSHRDWLESTKLMPVDEGELGGEWDLELVAERGRELLGLGEDEASVVAWRRFFDLVSADVSADVEQMIDAAYRVMGGVL
jgi:hypothetical protein